MVWRIQTASQHSQCEHRGHHGRQLVQDFTAWDTRRFNTKFPVAPQEDAGSYVEYVDLAMEIRRKKDDIVNFSQTLCAATFDKT
eukprot:4888573-Amphidinium_carterae.2